MSMRTLIEAEALASLLGDARLRVFDCRFDLARPAYGRAAYAEEHVPGAIFADLNADLSAPATATSGRHPLPAPEEFAARLRAWGVNADSRVVAYDDSNGAYAARLWWMLRWLGHDDVAVLDGGLQHRDLETALAQCLQQTGRGLGHGDRELLARRALHVYFRILNSTSRARMILHR